VPAEQRGAVVAVEPQPPGRVTQIPTVGDPERDAPGAGQSGDRLEGRSGAGLPDETGDNNPMPPATATNRLGALADSSDTGPSGTAGAVVAEPPGSRIAGTCPAAAATAGRRAGRLVVAAAVPATSPPVIAMTSHGCATTACANCPTNPTLATASAPADAPADAPA